MPRQQSSRMIPLPPTGVGAARGAASSGSSACCGNNNSSRNRYYHISATCLLCMNGLLMIVMVIQMFSKSFTGSSSPLGDGAFLLAQHENNNRQLRVEQPQPQPQVQVQQKTTNKYNYPNPGAGTTGTTTSSAPVAAAAIKTSASSSSSSTTTTTSNQQHKTEKLQRSFLQIAKRTQTDKVSAHANLKPCLEKGSPCIKPKFEREVCRPWGHFYDTLYQRWLGPKYSQDSTPPFMFLEIGFFSGRGFLAFQEFMPQAEAHSIEKNCVNDGVGIPLSNTAKMEHPRLYDQLRATNRLHCGSAVDYDFLDHIWTNYMTTRGGLRVDAPPLHVVVDDASHIAQDMIISVFYWFPKIEPGGFMIVEDIQPIPIANAFRTQFLPQLMSDIHWCGSEDEYPEQPFFDTIWPLLASVSCEMHICILERNQQPPRHDLSRQELTPPPYALDYQLALKMRKTEQSLK